jgi:hypothetical protein
MATVKRTCGGIMTSNVTTAEAKDICNQLFAEARVETGINVSIKVERINNALMQTRFRSLQVVQCWAKGGKLWYEVQQGSNGATLARAKTPSRAFATFAIGLGVYSVDGVSA